MKKNDEDYTTKVQLVLEAMTEIASPKTKN
jgi:hypothetical protein